MIRPVLAISYLPDFITVAGGYSACRLLDEYGYNSRAWRIGLSAIRFYNLNELGYWGGDISYRGWTVAYHWMSWPSYRFRASTLSRVTPSNHHWQVLMAYQVLDERIGDWYRKTLYLPTIGFRYRFPYLTAAMIANRQWVSTGCEFGSDRFKLGLNGFRLSDNARVDYTVSLNLLPGSSLRCLIHYDLIRQIFGTALTIRTEDWNWWIGIRFHPRLPETLLLRSHLIL